MPSRKGGDPPLQLHSKHYAAYNVAAWQVIGSEKLVSCGVVQDRCPLARQQVPVSDGALRREESQLDGFVEATAWGDGSLGYPPQG